MKFTPRQFAVLCIVALSNPHAAWSMEEEGNPGSEIDISESIDISDDEGNSVASPKSNTITLTHKVSHRPRYMSGIVNNRSSFRVEYSNYFWDAFFVRLDSKENLFWNNDHRAKAEQETYLFENITPEAFVQYSGAGSSISVTAGLQKLIWGESEGGVITDVVSPRNFSELFFIPLEESRLGQFMLSTDYFSSYGDWTVFYVPRAKFNKMPEPGTAYYIDPFGGAAEVQDNISDGNRYEYGARWKKTFGRSDVSVMAANLIDNDYAFQRKGASDAGQPVIARVEQRLTMTGVAFNYVVGDFLFKGEMGLKSPKAFNNSDFSLIERDVIDSALGFTYSLGGSNSLGVEFVNSHIVDWSEEIESAPQDANSMVMDMTLYFLNDTLGINWLNIYQRPFESLTSSLRTSYDWSDNLTFSFDVHVIDVDDARSELYPQRDQDQLFLGIQYKF